MQEIDKEKFIKDIKQDLGIKERNYGEDHKLETFDDFDLGEIFASFFGGKSSEDRKNDFDNPNNVTIDYWVDAGTARTKHNKTFNYKINNNGVMEKKKIKINIPEHIRTGQVILVRDGGNRDRDSIGNLIINIHLKH